MSWIHEPGGYQLLCNRDEKLTRLPALGPAVTGRNGVRFIAPRDQDFGGAWIAVNELGVSVCLLNGQGSTPEAARSRGTIVLTAGDARTAFDAVDRIANSCLRYFAPFTLLALDLTGHSSLCIWNGITADVIADAAALMPLTSSSFEPEQVAERRRNSFRRMRDRLGAVTPELLFDFHRSTCYDGLLQKP